MTTQIGAFDAKTHLSEYPERATRGERFTITRRGAPVAELGPHQTGAGESRTILQQCAEFRRRIGAGRPAFDIVEAVRQDRDR